MNAEPIGIATRIVGDLASVSVLIGTLAHILPPLAALATFIWYSIKIYDRFRGNRSD